MNLDSARAFKAEVSAEVIAAAGDTPAVHSFFAATEPPMPEGVALGIAKRDDGEHVVAIRTDSQAKADVLAARVSGEADIRILTVTKRNTAGYYQGIVRPLEAGAQVAMADKNFVGTLGCFVRDASGRLYALSNSHVLADEGRVAAGWRVGQPLQTSPIGVLARFVPFSATAPNLVDAAIMRVDKTATMPKWNGALKANLTGRRALTSDDLGRPVRKAGRTTGGSVGKVTAVEVDGLPVAYDSGVLRFNNQHEFSGGPTTDFSAPGDSGSLIVTEDGMAVALLFAGGRDGTGEDFTYGNPLLAVLEALGVEMAL